MTEFNLGENFAAVWDSGNKVPFEGVPFGSVVLIREIVDEDEYEEGEDDEDEDVLATSEINYTVVIPFSDNLHAYKTKDKGYLCKITGLVRSSIVRFKSRTEYTDEDRAVRKCVVLFEGPQPKQEPLKKQVTTARKVQLIDLMAEHSLKIDVNEEGENKGEIAVFSVEGGMWGDSFYFLVGDKASYIEALDKAITSWVETNR